MECLKVSQVATLLGITPTAVYKKFKTSSELIQNHIRKENGITYLTKDGFEILKGTMQNHQHDAILTKFEPVHNLVQSLEKRISEQQTIITNFHKTIDSIMLQHAEERARADTIIMKMAHDLDATRKSTLAIEAKVDALVKKPEQELVAEILQKTTAEIKPWEPPAKVKDPLKNKPWYQKLWVELVEPWKMRQHVS